MLKLKKSAISNVSHLNEYLEKKKKDEEEEKKKKQKQQTSGGLSLKSSAVKDIAPVVSSKTEDSTWFKKSDYFDDGWQFGDVTKTILGTVADAGEDIISGAVGMGETALDYLLTLGTAMNKANTAQANFNLMSSPYAFTKKGKEIAPGLVATNNALQKESERITSDFVKKDLYDAEKIAKAIISAPIKEHTGMNVEGASVLGKRSDSLAQSGGQLLGTVALEALGVPWFLTMGLTSAGAETENALKQGATLEQATMSGLISAGAEILSEKLSGGIKFGGKTLDDVLLKPFTEKISNKAVKSLVNLGVDAVGEGAEEIFSGVFSNLGTALYKEDSIGELLMSEEAVDGYIEGFIGGAVLGGFSNGVRSVANRNAIELTDIEQKVFDKVVEDRIAEKQKDGKAVSAKDEGKIRTNVLRDLLKGNISTDTIESVLGGDEYESYKKVIEARNKYESLTNKETSMLQEEYKNLQEEYNELNKLDLTKAKLGDHNRQTEIKDRMAEIEAKIEKNNLSLEEFKKDSILSDKKKSISKNVFDIVKDSRLAESYYEADRQNYKFQADVSKYKNENARKTVQSAIDSGLLNNRNTTHEFVDMVAKISADKGMSFDFVDNKKIQETGFAVEGKTVNGYKTDEGNIAVNIKAKKALNVVVGHEITHILEGTEFYSELQQVVENYAKAKGEYDTRYQALSKMYEGVYDAETFDESIKEELTADMVGEYLFTDAEFVNRLSTEKPNLFKRIYDEIKYLCKVATAGSKEARELEKVKKAFEKAYKESAKSADTKLSISETTDGRIVAVVDSDILDKIDTSSWDNAKKETAKKAASNALKQFSNGIVVEGITHKVNRTSRKEYTRSQYTESLYNNSPDVFADKMRAADIVDDIVVATTNWNRDNGLKHPRDDNFVDFDHGTTLIACGNAKYSATVVVGITKNGEAVFYDVVDMRPIDFKIKNVESPTTATTHNAIGSINGNSTKDILSQNSEKSSSDTEYSLSPETESKYNEAVKNKDTETAQRIVDEVAKENGYTIKAYHATNADFTAFDIDKTSDVNYHGKGIYFTNSTKDVENNYENYEGPDPWQKIEERAYELAEEKYGFSYEDTLTGDADVIDKLNECYDEAIAEFKSTIRRVTTYLKFDNPLILKKGDNKQYDLSQYDGIIDEQVYENIGHSGMDENTVHYVVFNPRNIKSADAITYDDNGNVIPLSERFNEGKNDIRYSLSADSEGNKLTEGQREYFKNSKAVDGNGNLKVVYHGTRNADFTVFKRNVTYFTDSKEMADSYSPNGDMFEGYVNITKPYEIDAKGEKWSRIPIDNDTVKFLKEYGASVFKEGGKWCTTPADIASAIEEAVDNGELDYDGIIIKNIDDTGSYYKGKDKHLATDYIVFNSNQFKNADNLKPTPDKDIRFSLSENVEETKDLVAVHNLSEEKLMKSLKLGGLPMPSIAIARAKEGHSSFGTISLVFSKDTISPTNRQNKVYSGDAWTPTYPRVEYEVSDKAQAKIERRINRLVSEDVLKDLGGLRIDSDNLQDDLNRFNGNMVDAFRNNTALKYAFLVESGHKLELPTKNKSLSIYSNHKDEAIIRVAETVSEDKLRGILQEYTTEQVYEVEPEIRKAVNEYLYEKHKNLPEEAREALILKGEMPRGDIDKYAQEALNYLKNGLEQEIDYRVSRELIDEATDTQKYASWVEDLFTDIVKSEGIRNNRDFFTPSGNRRSFKALHYEHTLENVVKAMKETGEKGVGAFGGGNIFGAATTEYSSIADIKKDAQKRMKMMSEDEYDAIRKGFRDRLFDLAYSLPIHKDSFTAVDDASNMLIEAVSKYKTRSGMANYLRNESRGWANYSEHIVDDLIELVNDIRNMPVGYFEAKPQRAVGFNEVVTAIIPDNASEVLKQTLAENGVKFVEYEKGNEQARIEVLNSLEDYKFSLSEPNETPKRKYGEIYGEDVRYQPTEDIAPVKSTASKTEQLAGELVDEADYAPIKKATEQKADAPDIAPIKNTGKQKFTTLDIVDDDTEVNEAEAKVNETETEVKSEEAKVKSEEASSVSVSLSDTSLDNIAKTVRKALSLTPAEKKTVKEIVSRYAESGVRDTERLYKELRDNFAERSYKERVEEIADVKHALKSFKIFVPQNIKNGITDYSDFRRRNFGKLTISNEGTSVDKVYEALTYSFPNFFPPDIANDTDRLMQMEEVGNLENYKDGTDMLSDESIREVAEVVDDVVNTAKEKQVAKEAERLEKEKNRPMKRSELHGKIIDGFKAVFRDKGFDMDKVLSKAKNLSTIRTNDNTPQRVMEKSLGYKEGGILADLTVNKVAQNETEGIKWLNSFLDKKNGLLVQISKQYGIKPGSKESAAAQMYAEGFYVNSKDEILEYGDKELIKDFKDPKVRENIIKLARDERIRQIYDETLNAINESRRRNLYPEIPRLDNYFLHFRAMGDTFSRLGLPFNPNDIRANDLPTDLNGVTADLKPGQPYFASAKHREGIRTSFDLLGGLEKYLTSAKNQIYHIDDIQNLRALRNYIADTYGQAKGLENLDSLSEEEMQERIKQVYGAHLSNFAKFLNEEANVLAGKKSLIDRGIEGAVGRRAFVFLDTVNRQVGSNMVGFNLSSSLTNILPVVQTMAKTNKSDFYKAMAQTVSNKFNALHGKSDGFAENSPVIIRRKGAESFYRTPFQKIGDTGYILMSAVDDVSTEIIARTKYNELTGKGMDSQTAHFETDKWVSRLMGDRSLGQQPLLYNSKVLGIVTKFQLEVRNQLDSQFYDTIQEAKLSTEDIQNKLQRNAKTAAKVASTMFQLAVLQNVFGTAFEAVAGYNPAFDIIEVIATALGFDDDEDDEDTVLDNIEEGFFALMEDLPYTSTLTGGRIPISSALPITELVKGQDEYGNDVLRVETLKEIAPYYILPTGYGQIKKTAKGLQMFSDKYPIKGSYTDSGNLRFPVDDTAGNRVQAALFGQYASKNAREYFDEGFAPLKDKQIEEFKETGMSYGDYQKYRKGLSGLKTLNEKGDYIGGLDVPVSTKNILINNIADRDEPIDMSDYGKYKDFQEFDLASRYDEKYRVLKEQGVSVKDYKENHEKTVMIFTDDYSWAADNPEQYAISKAVTDDVTVFRKYKKDISAFEADKDKYGNSINGSKKKKQKDYIFSLPIEYGQQIILYRSLFDSKADKRAYNNDIIDYLESREDLSYEDKITILEKLDFTVDDEGYVTW